MWKDANTGRVARWGGALRGRDGQTSRLRGVLRGEPQAAVRRTVRHHGQPRRGRGDPPGRVPEAVGAVGPRIRGGGPGGVPVPHRDQCVPEPAAPGPSGGAEDPDAGAQDRRPGGGGVPERPDQHPAGAHPPTEGSAGPDRLSGLLVGGSRPGAGGPGLHGAGPGHPGSGVRPSEGGGADVIDQRERFERAFELFDLPERAMARLGARRQRKERNRRVGTAVVAIAVAAAAFGGLARAFLSGPEPRPAEQPTSPFVGTWVSTDLDGSAQTMTVRTAGETAVEIVGRDDSASVRAGGPSTTTGTGRLDGATELVIPSPVLSCDDGSEPEVESGPPLEEQLRNLTFVHDLEADTLTDNFGVVWDRGGTTAGGMWPQSSLEEVRQAQELADAGDPRYTWQVDPALVGDAAPWGAEIFDRFIREVLGWEEFSNLGDYAYGEAGGLYDELVFLRCAPGRTNPLYPDDPQGRGCAPTIDDFRYETAMLTVEQPARRDPSGIWVVTGWEMLQPGEPSSLFDLLSPDFTGRQVEQVAPPSDAKAIALLQAFLGARVDGEGAE